MTEGTPASSNLRHKEKPAPPEHFYSRFKQQRLHGAYADHDAFALLIALAVVTVITAPLGGVILEASSSLFHTDIRYDDIRRCNYTHNDALQVFHVGNETYNQGCRTVLTFNISKRVSSPLLLQYRLVNFFQNYREYYQSRDDLQLAGEMVMKTDITDCRPLSWPGEIFREYETYAKRKADGIYYSDFIYSPCGTIAWSMFNDTIALYRLPDSRSDDDGSSSTSHDKTLADLASGDKLPASITPICIGGAFDNQGTKLIPSTGNCRKKGIALAVDTDSRFKKPFTAKNVWTGPTTNSNSYENTKGSDSNSSNTYRARGWYLDEPGHALPNATDEDFMVWSRVALYSDFSKLYRIIENDLLPGSYAFVIEEYFDVSLFEGEKHVILSTNSWVGGQQRVLGALLVGTGGLSFVLAVVVVLHRVLKQAVKRD